MNDKNTYSVDRYLEIIAEKEGITKEEVQQEIGRAVSIALKSPDPKTVSYTHLDVYKRQIRLSLKVLPRKMMVNMQNTIMQSV